MIHAKLTTRKCSKEGDAKRSNREFHACAYSFLGIKFKMDEKVFLAGLCSSLLHTMALLYTFVRSLALRHCAEVLR